MTEAFDPYRKWLGIPPSQQPPHHYRLLGIELYESDTDVIDTAAGQRMSYLQELAGGQYVKESQRLLNEVSAARRCLLDTKRKGEYDADLKAKLTPPPAPAAPAAVAAPPKQAKALPKVVAAEADEETVTLNISDATAKLRNRPSSTNGSASPAAKSSKTKSSSKKTAESTATNSDAASSEAKPPRRKKKSSVPAFALVAVAVALAGGGAFVMRDKFSAHESSEAADPDAATTDSSYVDYGDDVEAERAIPLPASRERKPFGAAPVPVVGDAASGSVPTAPPASTFDFAANLSQQAKPKPTATATATAARSAKAVAKPVPAATPGGTAVAESERMFTPPSGLPKFGPSKTPATAKPSGTAKPVGSATATPTAKP